MIGGGGSDPPSSHVGCSEFFHLSHCFTLIEHYLSSKNKTVNLVPSWRYSQRFDSATRHDRGGGSDPPSSHVGCSEFFHLLHCFTLIEHYLSSKNKTVNLVPSWRYSQRFDSATRHDRGGGVWPSLLSCWLFRIFPFE